MEHRSTKYKPIGTNRTTGTNGQVEWTTTQRGALKYILSLYNDMHFTNEHRSTKCNSIGTNRTIGTNGQVEWTTAQPRAHKDF